MKQTAIYQKKRRHASRWSNKWIQSPPALTAFCFIILICLVLFVVSAVVDRIHPGSTWGHGFGIAAAALQVGVLLWLVRRRSMRLTFSGRAWPYLQFHVYGGILFLLMVFLHTGFRLPQGVISMWLWLMSIWITLSGLLGILIQKWIPAVLTSSLTVEVHYDRIPDLVDEAREKAAQIVELCDTPVKDFYQAKLASIMEGPQPRLLYFLDISAGQTSRLDQFDTLRKLLPAEEKEKLDVLHNICRTKMEMDAHLSLQRALHWWLYLHIPAAVVLLVLTVIHIFVVLYY